VLPSTSTLEFVVNSGNSGSNTSSGALIEVRGCVNISGRVDVLDSGASTESNNTHLALMVINPSCYSTESAQIKVPALFFCFSASIPLNITIIG